LTGEVPARIQQELERDFELVATLEGAQGLLVVGSTIVDDALLDAVGPQLQVVAKYAVGVDNIDLPACRSRGVVVTNTPDVLTRATAELALALTLALLRRVAEGDRFIRARREWEFSLEFMLGQSLDDKTVLVVGPGRIGHETARLAEALGAKTIFAGRSDDLASLVAEADVVSIHCPLTIETTHLFDEPMIARMKPSAVLVNVARGPVVDEAALVRALRAGRIAGAALDVYEREPHVSEELLDLDNVVLTPHLGSATRTTREAMGLLAVSALRAVLLEGRVPPNVVP
jgi:glyoxylate reductase